MTVPTIVETREPYLARDWAGGLVETIRVLQNGWVQIPVGSILEVDVRNSKRISLRGFPCTCCGMRPIITMAPSDRIYSVKWRGIPAKQN